MGSLYVALFVALCRFVFVVVVEVDLVAAFFQVVAEVVVLVLSVVAFVAVVGWSLW